MCTWFVRKHIMFWRLWVTWEYYMVVKISCLSFFYPVAKLKPYLNPAYCLDRGFIFLPGHLNLSGEKEDYVTAITLNSLSPTSNGPLVLCSSFSIFTCLSEELAFFFFFLHSLFIQITFQYLCVLLSVFKIRCCV